MEDEQGVYSIISFDVRYLLVVFFCLLSSSLFSQVSICSWNLQNFGKSKSEEDILFIAATLKGFDIVAIEEVQAGADGIVAVDRLCHALQKIGDKWSYRVSEPTSSYSNIQQQERYAFLWKVNKVQLKEERLADKYEQEIEREPYIATFSFEGESFSVAAFHALPKKKQPEKEIKYLRFLNDPKQSMPLVFLGDFNCPESHTVFLPLKNNGYRNALKDQKTTLKQECKHGECLASEYDNIFYPGKRMQVHNSGIIPFYKSFGGDMKKARRLSDHLPVFAVFSLN